MNIRMIFAFIIAALFSSCTTYVVHEEGHGTPMMPPPRVRPAPAVVLGATAPGLHISLSGHDHGARPISVRPHIVRVVHECAQYRIVLLSNGREVRQDNPRYRNNGGHSGGNYGYPGNGGAYGDDPYRRYVDPRSYSSRSGRAMPYRGPINYEGFLRQYPAIDPNQRRY